MNKTEFIKLFAKNMNTSATIADKSLKIVLNTISETIAQENNLVFVGFGTFKTTISKAKTVRTPRGTIVDVSEKRIVRFSPGTKLKAKVNSKK